MNTKNLKDIWKSINLVDKFLIFLMMVFLLYSIMTIYIEKANLEVIANIDIVVRTSMASIFGYFISANFIEHQSIKNKFEIENIILQDTKIISKKTSDDTTTSKIGFNVTDDDTIKSSETEIGSTYIETPTESFPEKNSIKIQTFVVGIMCVMATFALLVTRFSVTTTSNDAAALSQLRDIICGSIGFLIGMPSELVNKQ